MEFGSNTTDKFEISQGKAKWNFKGLKRVNLLSYPLCLDFVNFLFLKVVFDIFKVKLFTVLLVECTALWDSEMWVWETFCSIVSLKQLTSPDILLQICISCSYISYFPFNCFLRFLVLIYQYIISVLIFLSYFFAKCKSGKPFVLLCNSTS